MIPYFPAVRASYAAADIVQQRLSRLLLDAKKPGGPAASMAFLAYEMNPTYTVGRRQIGKLPSQEREFLETEGRADFVETSRGGHTTFHGPGQAVIYPVLDLQRLKVRVRDYVCILEKSIVAVLARHFAVEAEQRTGAGMNGVWLAGTQQKIASVGVHVQRSVTTHGLALNVNTDPFWFDRIVACNLPDAKMVSLATFTPREPSVEEVATLVVKEIAARLDAQLEEKTTHQSLELLSATSAAHLQGRER